MISINLTYFTGSPLHSLTARHILFLSHNWDEKCLINVLCLDQVLTCWHKLTPNHVNAHDDFSRVTVGVHQQHARGRVGWWQPPVTQLCMSILPLPIQGYLMVFSSGLRCSQLLASPGTTVRPEVEEPGSRPQSPTRAVVLPSNEVFP